MKIDTEAFIKMIKKNDQDARNCLVDLVKTEQKELAKELWFASLDDKECEKIIYKWQDDRVVSAAIRKIFDKPTNT